MNIKYLLAAPIAGAILSVSITPATAGASAAQEKPVPITQVAGEKIANEYIFKTKEGLDPRQVASRLGIQPKHVYRGGSARGFSATAAGKTLSSAQSRGDLIDSIVENSVVNATATQSTVDAGLWGLDRIDQVSLPLNQTYQYTSTASGIHAYVVDSGIQSSHPQFGLFRTSNDFDINGTPAGTDCHGHGTHVAGIIGSSTHGVAKSVRLHGIKVTPACSAGTSAANVMAGLDWILLNGKKPAVVNISMAGAFNLFLNQKATDLVNAGYFVAAGAGNNGEDSCSVSPASAVGVMNVAASDKTDKRMVNLDGVTSATGLCTALYAPGHAIRSTYIGSQTATDSGTSMATAFVSGVAALRLKTNPTASSAYNWIMENAKPKITNAPAFTTDLLLHKGPLL
ncbi:S8 family peptidase [Streptomyces sp. NPDC015127]|uniref:S8 family peptidase n=1 Tax=Streptomyces sp. NPDC015127 TaxID=3364939 RepID=UPI0036F65BF3